jgi:dienelactone hydrolase
MMASQLFTPDPSEPLAFQSTARNTPEVFGKASCVAFEYTSRGDRVPGRLLLPESQSAPAPLILLQHGITGSKDAEYLKVAAPWVRGGAAVATIDFPLHGERASAKLSDRLVDAVRGAVAERSGAELSAVDRILWAEFMRQSVLDLQRCIDALSSLHEVNAERVAYVGLSLGAIVGAIYCAVDPRSRGAALALGGGGFGPSEADPCHWVGHIAPRPVLFVNAKADEQIPGWAAQALHDAASEPKEVQWFDATHTTIPGQSMKSIWQFMQSVLEMKSA